LKTPPSTARRLVDETGLYRSLAESSVDAIYVHKGDEVLYANPALARLLLADSVEDVIGTSIYDFIHPDDQAQARERMEAIRNNPEPAPFRKRRWIRRDGSTVEVEVGATRFMDGNEVALLVIARDITERRQAEEALRAAQERLRTVVSGAPIVLFAVDREGVFTLSEGKGLEGLGLKPGQVVGLSVFDVYKDAPQVLANVRRALTGETFSDSVDVKGGPGAGLVFETRFIPLFDREGRVTGVSGVATDVTEHRRAATALRASEERLRSIVQSEPECVKLVGPAGTLLDMNPAGLRMIEAETLAQVANQPILSLVTPEHRAAFADLHRRVMAGGSGELEFQIVGLKGTRRWMDTRAVPLRNADGDVTALLGITRDITERKHAEEARLRLEAQLTQAHKMEAIGTLAGGIAHDFNNILGAIIGNVELATQDVGVAHPATGSLHEIRKAAQRAKGLVQQILAFTRQQALERRVVALRPLIEETAKLLRATLPASAELSVRCADDVPNVLADPVQVEQILLNLVTNAWHALEGRPGAIAIDLRACSVESGSAGARPGVKAGSYARISVSDTGHGMDEATLQRIFDPFFTTKAPGLGTGLGLSVVHGIVSGYGGAIEVASTPRRGTTFDLYFPAATGRMEPARAKQAGVLRGEGQHILYLDDEEALVLLSTRLFERLGYRVSGYTKAPDALAAFRAAPDSFDIAVTDYSMPGASGLDVARDLLEVRADLPIVLASGYITDELQAHALQIGVRHLLYKPNTVEELCEVVHRLVGDFARQASL
jgi:PAS domain S-box-containing protein